MLPQGEIPQRQVHALDHDPEHLVDRGRDAEPDRPDVRLEQLLNRRLELANDGILRIVGRRALMAAQDLPVPRDDAGQDLRAAEVDADRVCVHAQRVP